MSFGQFNTSSAIVPMDQQQYHHHQPQPMGIPNVKRQPLGGRKSHKLLDEASTQNLFVARLPRSLGNDELLALFAEFHPLTATVMMDVGTGKSKGFGFVTFESVEQGQVALEAMSSRLHQSPGEPNFTIEIKPSTFNGKRIVVESRYVYFRNFPAQAFPSLHSGSSFECEVSSFFVQLCGSQVSNAEFHGRSPMSCVAPAFLVSFANQAGAEAAIAACHGKVLFPDLSSTPIMAKYADLTTVKIMLDRQTGGSPKGSPVPQSVPLTANAPASMRHQYVNPCIVPPSHHSSVTNNGLSIGSSGFVSPQVFWSPVSGLAAPAPWLSVPSAPSCRSSGSVSSSDNSPCLAVHLTHYRNDPYNQTGRVEVSSSSSSSSVAGMSTCSLD